MKRDLRIDSTKGLLLILVILGHTIEMTDQSWFSQKIYDFIYVFHMPLFIYISGMLSKKKDSFKAFCISLGHILIPLVFFQFIHVSILLLKGESLAFHHFLIPCWTLWYLLSLAYWKTGIQLFSVFLHKNPFACLCISIILSLICGLLPGGRLLSIQRTFHFLPFFLLGYYNGRNIISNISLSRPIASIMLLSVAFIAFRFLPHDTRWLLYGSIGYETDRIIAKAFLLICSFCASFSLFNLIQENSFLSYIGRNSIVFYMYHSLIIMYVITPAICRYNLPKDYIVYSLGYAIVTIGIIGLARKLKIINFLANPLK